MLLCLCGFCFCLQPSRSMFPQRECTCEWNVSFDGLDMKNFAVRQLDIKLQDEMMITFSS